MRKSDLLLLASCSLFAGCATQAHVVATDSSRLISVRQAARELATADVVVLGEEHDAGAVHATHLDLLRQLHAERRVVTIAMEMFERDVQPVLLRYLNGLCSEEEFQAAARPWPNYRSDYKPFLDFARSKNLTVLAANAPRPLASRVAKQGIDSIAGEPHVARETSAPEDAYWEAFQAAMQGHMGTGSEAAMKRMYAAQCLKDDTMAETVVDYLQERHGAGERPLVVLIVGKGHSDNRRGVVPRILGRMPTADVRVLSCVSVESLSDSRAKADALLGDYVIVARRQPREAPVARPLPRPQPAATTAPAAPEPAEPADEGQRPALGLMPDYAASVEGVLVQSVREGGPAEQAGIEAGDVITQVGGQPVTDVESYTDALDAQRVGRLVPVRVRRGEAEVELQVRIGARAR